jgi:hypothetical protein
MMAEDFQLFVVVGLVVLAFMAGCLLLFGRISPAWARSIWQGERILFGFGVLVWIVFFNAAAALSDRVGVGTFVPELSAAIGINLVVPYLICRPLARRLMEPTAPPR